MLNFGQIQNGSIFRIFGSVRALALKISHRDHFKWIPRTQISLDEKIGQMENGSIFRIFGSVRAVALKISHGDLKNLVILRRFSCAVYGQIMILLCDLWLCRLWARCAFYG